LTTDTDQSDVCIEPKIYSGDSGSSAARLRSPAKEKGYAKNKPEVVPVAIVVDLVDRHIIAEQADDKSKKGNEAVPQTHPETGGFFYEFFVSGGTGGEYQGSKSKKQHRFQVNSFLHDWEF
jgi:hypothetical protein